MTRPVLHLIGGGMGAPDLLTGEARARIAAAPRLYAPHRLAERLRAIRPDVVAAGIGEIRAALEEQTGDAAVVLSGDCGFYSLSRPLARDFSGRYDVRCTNGLSSLQYLAAKLGIPYDDIHTVSLHGRRGGILGAVSYHRRVFVLTGGDNPPEAVLGELCEHGLGHVAVTVGENLSAPDERICAGTAESLRGERFPGIAVLLVENPNPAGTHRRLRDEDFIRGDTPMTKESVRTLSVARLEVRPGDTVWDVGAGTGSVSVALACAAREGLVCAVERGEDAAALIRANRDRFGTHNIAVFRGEAPGCLEPLPPPDKVFVGGSGGQMRGILEAALRKANELTVCVNAVTLESLGEALACLEELDFSDIEVQCVNMSVARQAGRYRMMTAQNPVHIVSGRRRRE